MDRGRCMQGSQQQKLKFQDQVFCKFQDNFGTFDGINNLNTYKLITRYLAKSVINIKKVFIRYNITNEVDEIVVLPCICISKILNSHILCQNYGQYQDICTK